MASNDPFFDTFQCSSSGSAKKFTFKKLGANDKNKTEHNSYQNKHDITKETSSLDHQQTDKRKENTSSVLSKIPENKGTRSEEADFKSSDTLKKLLTTPTKSLQPAKSNETKTNRENKMNSPNLRMLRPRSISQKKNTIRSFLQKMDSEDAFDLIVSPKIKTKPETSRNSKPNEFAVLKKNFNESLTEWPSLNAKVEKDPILIVSSSLEKEELTDRKKKFIFKKKEENVVVNNNKQDSSHVKLETLKNSVKCSPNKDDHINRIDMEKSKSTTKFKFKKNSDSSSSQENKAECSQKSTLSNSPAKVQPKDEINIVDTLVISDSDYMDDAEFDRLYGSSTDASTQNETTAKSVVSGDYLDDDINLDDIDWDSEIPTIKTNTRDECEDLLEGVNLADFEDAESTSSFKFSGRVDSSKEFVGDYPHSQVMMEVLHSRFGLRQFRPHQREICNASLTGHDVFVLMPTGGGKSLCYQLPATLTPGVSIVISPLRSLISDQVDKLNALDIPSAHLCADQTKEETETILSKLYTKEPEIKLLFLTPEKISASRQCGSALDYLYARDKLARFIIDEAHCLSQWGHDFRPDYKQLSCLRIKYPKVAIICLTATATKQVEGDVINILKLRNVKTFIRSFNRPNIKYKVIQKEKANVIDQISALIRSKFYKKSGIVYCLSRNDCESVAEQLKRQGIQAMPYHAGMSSNVRDTIQRQWMQDRFNVIVGTIAFGMGIDKPDVRFVIHNSIPKSVEAFYQESGRAGRDGEVSYSYLYYGYNDVKRLQKIMMLEKSNKRAIEGHFDALKTMVSYCENHVDCRRYLQLIHLGETFDRQICIKNKETTCDNCEEIKSYSQVDMSVHAKNLCEMIKDFAQRRDKVTLPQISEVYKGSKAKKILERRHDKHPHYSKGASLDRVDIQRILKQLLVKDVLNEHCEYSGAGFPVVYVQPGKKYFLSQSKDFKVSLSVNNKNKSSMSVSIEKPERNSTSSPSIPDQKLPTSTRPIASTSKAETSTTSTLSKQEISSLKVKCHEDLLEECRRLALERNMTLSSIMNLSAIKKMSDVLPNTKEEMLKIQHVTAANYEKYGEFFLKITKKFAEELASKMAEFEKKKGSSAPRPVSYDDDGDWWCDSSLPSTSSGKGVKRKSFGGYKRSTKRFKRNTWKSKGAKSKAKSGKAKGSPKKKGASTKGLGLMPVLHIS